MPNIPILHKGQKHPEPMKSFSKEELIEVVKEKNPLPDKFTILAKTFNGDRSKEFSEAMKQVFNLGFKVRFINSSNYITKEGKISMCLYHVSKDGKV